MRDTRKIEADVNNPRLRRMFPRGNSMAALLKLLLFTLLMHTACTSLRFTATLDAIHAGASSFEVGLMLASISFGPMFLAIAAGRWLDRSGPRAPMLASRLSVMAAAGCAILLPASDLGIAPLFGACVLTGLSFMLTNVVIQRLTGDVTTPKNRRFAFTALSLTTASSNLAAPVVAGYVIERLSYTAVYVWSAVAPLILSVLLFVPAFGIVMKARPRAVRAEAGRTKGAAADFLRDGPMRAVLVASVIISIAWEVGNLLIPIYAAGVGLTPSEIGWVLGSFAAATFIVRFVTPFLLKVVLEWHMIVLSRHGGLCRHAARHHPGRHDGRRLRARARPRGVASQHDVPRLPLLAARAHWRGHRPSHHGAQPRQVGLSRPRRAPRQLDRRGLHHLVPRGLRRRRMRVRGRCGPHRALEDEGAQGRENRWMSPG